jgi:hypothetical protein
MKKETHLVAQSQLVIVILFAILAPLKLEVIMYSPAGNLMFNAA